MTLNATKNRSIDVICRMLSEQQAPYPPRTTPTRMIHCYQNMHKWTESISNPTTKTNAFMAKNGVKENSFCANISPFKALRLWYNKSRSATMHHIYFLNKDTISYACFGTFDVKVLTWTSNFFTARAVSTRTSTSAVSLSNGLGSHWSSNARPALAWSERNSAEWGHENRVDRTQEEKLCHDDGVMKYDGKKSLEE